MVLALLCGCEFITGALEVPSESDTEGSVEDAIGESGPTPGSGSAESSETSADAPTPSSTTDDGDQEGGSPTSAGSGTRDPNDGTSDTGDGWGTTSDGVPETYGGSCCEPGLGPECGDPAITECVCAIDSWCCEKEWDAICADLVQDAGCGSCGDVGPSSTDNASCCAPQAGPGCVMNDVALCVCQTDPYCCDMFWDGTCASEVELLGCGECGLGDATTGIEPFGETDGDTDGTGPASESSTGG